MLTREQRDKYLANGGVRCPFCDSIDMEGEEPHQEDSGMYQEVHCYACDGSWTDVYKLVDVEDA